MLLSGYIHRNPLRAVIVRRLVDYPWSSYPIYAYKINRDLLIYLLWSTGWYSNQEIGNLFGLGYSSISRRVSIMKTMIAKDGKLKKRFTRLKSQIKM